MNTTGTFKWCVIIPTYNNHKTLKKVIDGVLQYTRDIIVVNDGSTDSSPEILKAYPRLTQIHFEENRGKGMALRRGFRRAAESGYDYAITIDSDGQHFPDDIPDFLAALEKEKDVLLIGSRNMAQEGVPKKSSFGNKFSNFWFWFETNIKLEDTQSGYRLYPLKKMPERFFTRKFEFEIEVIVRTAWKGVPVKNIPIKVHYDLHDRVSHFRPFKDFSRISVLNTVLVIIALLYIKPRDFFRNLKKKDFKRILTEDILKSNDSNLKKSFSIALGVFMGLAPIWGFQTVTVLGAAFLLRLNKLIAFTFSNISLPPLIPFIIYASLKIGSVFTGGSVIPSLSELSSFAVIKQNLAQYIIGSFILAASMSVLFGLSGYLILSIPGITKNKKVANA